MPLPAIASVKLFKMYTRKILLAGISTQTYPGDNVFLLMMYDKPGAVNGNLKMALVKAGRITAITKVEY